MDIPHLTEELGDVLAYISMVADCVGISLEEVAATVIKKNEDRRARGVGTNAPDQGGT